MSTETQELLRRFEAQQIDPRGFRHETHIVVAYEMLRAYGFEETTARYARAIKALAAKAGAPEKYNCTITVGFLSRIAERMAADDRADAANFVAANPDLMTRDALAPWYSAERLQSDLARSTFLLPDAAP